MSIIVCNCQHCDEQQFQTLSCVHYTIFSVVKLDLFIRALLLDRILPLEKNYAYASRTSCFFIESYHETFTEIIVREGTKGACLKMVLEGNFQKVKDYKTNIIIIIIIGLPVA